MNSTSEQVFRIERIEEILILVPLRKVRTFCEADILDGTEMVLSEYARAEVRHVVIDFSEADYFGSILLEAVRLLWTKVKEKNGRVALCHLSKTGRDIINVAQFHTVWEICDDRDAAIAAVRGD